MWFFDKFRIIVVCCLNIEEFVFNGLIKIDGLKFIYYLSLFDGNDVFCKVIFKRSFIMSFKFYGLFWFFYINKVKIKRENLDFIIEIEYVFYFSDVFDYLLEKNGNWYLSLCFNYIYFEYIFICVIF